MTDLRNLSFDDLSRLVEDLGQPSFRAKQLFDWIHNKQVSHLRESSNLSHSLISELEALDYGIQVPLIRHHQVSKDGTEKFLLALSDSAQIECVLMKYRGDYSKQRNTLCVSSQVGCKMGCAFCATGFGGFQRNLTISEILSQVYLVNRHLKNEGEPMQVRNIVFMGMGEPFDNFDTVLKAIDLLRDPRGAGLSQRRITISTCGVVSGIRRFADLETDIGLAISLHAANDPDRSQLMPINRKYPLADLMDACRYYNWRTSRRISFEYALIQNVNDRPQDLTDLAALLKDLDCHINVIPVNAVRHAQSLQQPPRTATRAFVKKLNDLGIPASIREEKGADIDAACGQLKAKYEDN